MKCKNCGAELLDTDRFCINCGTLVDVKIENCPFCGEKLREGEKFCHRCGAEIPVPGETPKNVQPGTYPNALSTMEIGALTDAVIAAAQREIVNDDKKQESARPEPAAEERAPLFETGVSYKQESYDEETYEQEPYEEEPYEEEPQVPVRMQERGDQRARQKAERPQAAPSRTARREPPRREPQRGKQRPAYKQETDSTENVLNIAIIAGGILILVVLAAVLFIYARNEELIPRSGPRQEAEEQETKKKDKEKKEEKAEEEEDAAFEEEEVSGEGGMVRVTAGSLNIRDGSSTSGTQVIGKAKKGEEYPYIEKQGEWYYIDAGGVKGYVHQDYVEEVN